MARSSTMDTSAAPTTSASARRSSDPEREDSHSPQSVVVEDGDNPDKIRRRKERKIQHRFVPSRQILFLRATLAYKPWSKPHGSVTSAWENLANDYCTAVGDPTAINAEGARRHWERLLKMYNSGEKDSLKVSGTEEEYAEQEELLITLAYNANGFRNREESGKRRKRERQEYQDADFERTTLREVLNERHKEPRPSVPSPAPTPSPAPATENNRMEGIYLSYVEDVSGRNSGSSSSFLARSRDRERDRERERERERRERERERRYDYDYEGRREKKKSKKHRHHCRSDDLAEIKEEVKNANYLLRELVEARKNDIALLRKLLDLEERKLQEQTAERLHRERFYEYQLRMSTGGRKYFEGQSGLSGSMGEEP